MSAEPAVKAKRRRCAGPAQHTRRISAAALLAAVAVAVSGCAAQGADEPVRSASNVGYVEGKSLTIVKPADRKTAAVVVGPALDGNKTLSTADYPGKVVVLNIWGSWCAPCRKEAPDLAAASRTTRKTAQFLGIDIRDPDRAPAQAFVRSFKVPYPSIYDPDGKLLVRFAGDVTPNGIPTTLVLDEKGRIAVRVIGAISQRTLVDIIDQTAAGA